VPVSLAEIAPLATLVVLLELSVGTAAAAFLVDVTGRVGRGFVGTTALVCVGIMAIDLIIGFTVPADTPLVHGSVGAAALDGMVRWCVWFTVALLGLAFFCWVGTDIARRTVGVLTLAVGCIAIVAAAVAFGPPLGGAGAAALAFAPATLVAGCALAGMLLGHWYLIVPTLSFRPLRQVILLMFITLGVECVVLVCVIAVQPAAARQSLLVTQYALPFWLLVVGAGIGFTAAVTTLTRHFARIRANQPATAMLYALIISVSMGVVPAHLLFFVTGIPV
jgi:hypothetical protein